jgi:hypothetical protein
MAAEAGRSRETRRKTWLRARSEVFVPYGLKRDRTARVIFAAHAFIQNLRRGFYDLGTDVPPSARLADAFTELALVI